MATAAAILAIVFVGFAHTLYLRPLFDVPPIPVYLYLHGAVVTAWFGLVVVQTLLIRNGAVATHRRVGVAGLCLGVAVVVVSAIVTLRFVDRLMHTPTPQDVNLSVTLGFGADKPLVDLAATALWGNLTSLVTFGVLVGSAALLRRRARLSQAPDDPRVAQHPAAGDRAHLAMAGTRRRHGPARADRHARPAVRARLVRRPHPGTRAPGDTGRRRSNRGEHRRQQRGCGLRLRPMDSATARLVSRR